MATQPKIENIIDGTRPTDNNNNCPDPITTTQPKIENIIDGTRSTGNNNHCPITTNNGANSNTKHHYPGPNECIVYWNFDDNCIRNAHQFSYSIPILKKNICDKIGSKPVHFRIYSSSTNITHKIQDAFDINGINHMHISSNYPESVNKRILIDIMLQLYELEKYKQSKCIAFISNDEALSYLLSKIQKEPTMSHSIYVSFDTINRNNNIVQNIDFVIHHPLQNNNNNNTKKRKHSDDGIEQQNTTKKYKLNPVQTITVTFENAQSDRDEKFQTTISANMSVKKLRKKLKKLIPTDLPPILYFNGMLLKDPIYLYGVVDGCTIHWGLQHHKPYASHLRPLEYVIKKRKEKKMKTITIMCHNADSDAEQIKMTIIKTISVQTLRQTLKAKIPTALDPIIYCNGIILQNDKDPISLHGVRNGCVIRWCLTDAYAINVSFREFGTTDDVRFRISHNELVSSIYSRFARYLKNRNRLVVYRELRNRVVAHGLHLLSPNGKYIPQTKPKKHKDTQKRWCGVHVKHYGITDGSTLIWCIDAHVITVNILSAMTQNTHSLSVPVTSLHTRLMVKRERGGDLYYNGQNVKWTDRIVECGILNGHTLVFCSHNAAKYIKNEAKEMSTTLNKLKDESDNKQKKEETNDMNNASTEAQNDMNVVDDADVLIMNESKIPNAEKELDYGTKSKDIQRDSQHIKPIPNGIDTEALLVMNTLDMPQLEDDSDMSISDSESENEEMDENINDKMSNNNAATL